jgi:hypothetical protein
MDPFDAWVAWLVREGYAFCVESGRGDYYVIMEEE